MKTLKLLALAVIFAVGAATAPAHAGRTCEAKAISPQSLTQSMNLAVKVAQQLDASGAKVLLLARVGQDLRKYGLRYSHLGFAYKATLPDGSQRWLVAHKLNDCGTPHAAIFRQGLGEFFLDDMFAYEAAWVAPTPALQDQILALVSGPDIARLHTPAYSMLAYPWSTRYQQSNQWALETMALAADPFITNRSGAQNWLQSKGYTPTVLRISPLTRLGGRMTQANIAFDDHPDAKRYADQIETISVESVFSFMQRAQLGGAMAVIR
jgi:hypothetical protein